MIKNIILDVGGILFDDSKKHIENILNKNCDLIYKIAYGKGFKECLIKQKTVQEHIDSLVTVTDYEDIKYILAKENLEKSYPLMTKNFEYIRSLKYKGYKLYTFVQISYFFLKFSLANLLLLPVIPLPSCCLNHNIH